MSSSLQAPRGTYDLLPPESQRLLGVRHALSRAAELSGYGYIETPVFEDTALFSRGVGESTEVVTKQMYTFTDQGGRSLTLRPEGTAGVLRAALEAGLERGQLPVKLYYAGSYFRYEAPQAGRYRHFQQVGIEALGSEDPALDAEVISVAVNGHLALGLTEVRLLLNSLGDRTCRPAYQQALSDFLTGIELDEDTRARARRNPLRVLDDKRLEVRAQLDSAPLISSFLCRDCRQHYDEVREVLTELGVRWEEDPRLVRGLDYYTRTAFEFVHDSLGAQSAIGGGGRYDGLSEQLGGPPLPGIGFGLGVDRTALACQAEGVGPALQPRVAVFAVPLGRAAKRELIGLVAGLRASGISADLAYGDRGLKGAMKAADRSGARVAVVIGDRDLEAGVGQVRDLVSGEQFEETLDVVAERVRAVLASPPVAMSVGANGTGDPTP